MEFRIISMKQYITLIWNRSDAYDRYWVRQNPDETPEQFIMKLNHNQDERVKRNCDDACNNTCGHLGTIL